MSYEKVEKLEAWMAHFEEDVQCSFRRPPLPGTALNKPTSITSDD